LFMVSLIVAVIRSSQSYFSRGHHLIQPLARTPDLFITQKAGVNVVPVIVSNPDYIKNIISIDAHRSLLLVLREWKTDTYLNTALIYDVSLTVLDDSGKSIVEKTINGRDDLGGSFWNPPAHAKKEVPQAFKKKLKHC